MSKADPMAPINRFSNIAFVDEGNVYAALYPPNLTNAQVNAIPVTDALPGAIVFDTDTEELTTYSAAGHWLPILTAESDITVEEVNAETGNITNLNTTAIVNSATMQTINLNVISTIAAGSVTCSTFDSAGQATFNDIASDGQSTFNEVTIDSILAGNAVATPMTVVLDTGAGTGATATIQGSIMSGVFTLNTGSTPAAAGLIGTFTVPAGFLSYFGGKYGVIMYPGSVTTAEIPTFITTATNNVFIMGVGSSITLTASTQYVWNYHVISNKA